MYLPSTIIIYHYNCIYSSAAALIAQVLTCAAGLDLGAAGLRLGDGDGIPLVLHGTAPVLTKINDVLQTHGLIDMFC